MSTLSLLHPPSKHPGWWNSFHPSFRRGDSQTAPPLTHPAPSVSSIPPSPPPLPRSQLPTPPLTADSSVFLPIFQKPMPKTSRRSAARVPKSSLEFFENRQDLDFQSQNARPTRKGIKAAPIVDSEDESCDHTRPIERSRKRKRSPSPPLSDSADLDCVSDADLANAEYSDAASGKPLANQDGLIIRLSIQDLTIHVPHNHVGPVVVQLDATQAVQLASTKTSTSTSPTRTKRARLGAATTPLAPTHCAGTPNRYAGFLDLPAELRNEIYRLVLTTGGHFNFANPKHFGRSTALLRTCQTVHQEACSILYGENEFYFARRTSRYGSFWEDEWHEVGFRSIRKFLKSIGPKNTSFIKYISFQFEDATPCLNPESMTHDERRFVNDVHLMSVLRHLGTYSNLRQFDMNFHGRRRVENSDQRFLQHLRHIKADVVRFVPYPIGLQTAFATESKQEESVRQLLLKSMVRTHTPHT